MCYVYIIQCDEGKRYIGFSSNLAKRLIDHNEGKSKWTKRYKNWKIIYFKKFKNISEARKWENYLKRQKGGNGLDEIIKNGLLAHNPAWAGS